MPRVVEKMDGVSGAALLRGILLAGALGGAAELRAELSFNKDIRPILSNACFACHGPDEEERAADLRLDTREGALADLGNGFFAVVPGDPDKSELIYRVTSDDEDEVMPPPKHGKPLTADQIATLRQWIEEGAKYERHWSYVKPERTTPLEVADSGWVRNPIDGFVLSRLEQEKLKPSKEADRRVLARRVALDLTGLPPAPEEVDAFAEDQRPDAYERFVDQLMARPAFGEHWARMWLDLARYADSAGYADDPMRTIWEYRDYVIRSFNENKSFDEFTIEQLAGDLLENPTEDQLIATAFHRNTQTNNEGGTNDEEFRTVAVVDRVNTTSQVWLGTTMACAQCHTHKYDPITHEDYFRMYAILNNTADADRKDEAPVIRRLSEKEKQQKADFEKRLSVLEGKQKEAEAKGPAALSERTGPLPIRYLRVQAIGKGIFLHLAELEAYVGDRNVALDGTASQSSTAYNGPANLGNDGNRDGDHMVSKSVTHTGKEDNPWFELDLGSEQNLGKVQLWNRTDHGLASRLRHFRLIGMDADRQPVWVQEFKLTPNPSVDATPPASFEAFSKQQADALAAHHAQLLKEGSPLVRQIAELKKQLNGIQGTPTPIMRELPEGKRRETHIHLRGNWMSKGDKVQPGVPAALYPLPDNLTPNRMDLAKWLVDPGNPLTARVVVNRFWEKIFGIGIVATSEEFGSQGDQPSHPELLDWLAIEFVENGWDMKRLLRLLVTSASYRQDSAVSPELTARDPKNRLLARGPRFRLSAEMVRDQSLSVAGLLSDKMHGPPVHPPQPDMGLKAAFGGGIDWKTSAGEDRYRRGIYTTWRRSNPYPSMAAFDAPNREVCTVRRDRTNTPLQAFVTLNDPVYVEAAQGLARRMAEAAGSPVERVRHGYRLCFSRDPEPGELDRLMLLHDQAMETFASDPENAKRMATDPIGPIPKGRDPVELAALSVVGNVLLNLDEMLMKR
ncbi:MAG: DUF1553 domain-containing protein [Verrucomicrobiota bacterium]